jgi:hypothetical protein
MSGEAERRDDWLLDDHLDQLSPTERARLAEALRADPELAARYQRLQRVLEPLDLWTVPIPPRNLADRIISKVADRDTGRSTVPAASAAGGFDRGLIHRLPFALKDVVAVAAVIAIFGMILIPSLVRVRAEARRVACANNLASIGWAVGAYGADHDGVLPRVGTVSGGRWLRVSNGGGPYTPNRRNPFLLLRFGYVDRPNVFVCPSCSGARVMKVENPHALSDFPDPRNCAYHALNMAGPTPRLTEQPDLAYMADANPLFADGRFHRVNPESPSPNHRRMPGQNVLRLDGRVDWSQSPKYGANGDNIWQAGTLRVYRGTEVQRSPGDAFLVP